MFCDEFAGIDPAARVLSITRANKRCDEFAHLEMQMGKICAVRSSNGRDLLAAPHIIARPNEHRFDMPVIGLHVFANAVFFVGMQRR